VGAGGHLLSQVLGQPKILLYILLLYKEEDRRSV
jgi:hypothetical protein